MNTQELYDAFKANFASTIAEKPAVNRVYKQAGKYVSLHFSSDVLRTPLTRAIAHNECLPGEEPSELTIYLWTNKFELIKRIRATNPQQENTENQSYYISDRIKLSLGMEGAIVSMLNLEENVGLFWIDETVDLPVYVKAAPLRILWHWWLQKKEILLIHSGAVACGDDAVLLVGNSGAGKSTVALSCVLEGMEYLGDDYCLISTDPAPVVFSLYSSAKLHAAHLNKCFPMLVDHTLLTENPSGDKVVVYGSDVFPDRIRSHANIRAIVMPVMTGRRTPTIHRLSQATALQALAPSSLLQMPGLGQVEFHSLAQLIRKCPCYQLEFGENLATLADTLKSILR